MIEPGKCTQGHMQNSLYTITGDFWTPGSDHWALRVLGGCVGRGRELRVSREVRMVGQGLWTAFEFQTLSPLSLYGQSLGSVLFLFFFNFYLLILETKRNGKRERGEREIKETYLLSTY